MYYAVLTDMIFQYYYASIKLTLFICCWNLHVNN